MILVRLRPSLKKLVNQSAMAAGYGYEITSANDVLKMGAGEKESDQLRFAVLTGLVKVGQVSLKRAVSLGSIV